MRGPRRGRYGVQAQARAVQGADGGREERGILAVGQAQSEQGGHAGVPANCHADSDCGVGGYCSPSRGYCGSFQGFYCHTPSDTCIDATSDCQSCGENACIYSPAVGAFTCGAAICAG